MAFGRSRLSSGQCRFSAAGKHDRADERDGIHNRMASREIGCGCRADRSRLPLRWRWLARSMPYRSAFAVEIRFTSSMSTLSVSGGNSSMISRA